MTKRSSILLAPDTKGSTYGSFADDFTKSKPPLPTEVTGRSVDGTNRAIKVTPTLAFGIFGNSPPGGWYGPFGFLRMVAYAFLTLGFVGVVCLVTSLWCVGSQGLIPVFGALLLVASSFFAAFAAHAHEGLAAQVTQQAKLNDRFSALNENFNEQLSDLADVADALEKWAQRGEDTYTHLLSTVAALERVHALSKVGVIMRAFTDGEMRQWMMEDKKANKRLSTQGELNVFFDGTGELLKANLPEVDLAELKRLSLRGGIGLTVTSLIIAAVLGGSSEEEMMRTSGAMALVYFILDPKQPSRYEEADELVTAILQNVPKFQQEGSVSQELRRMQQTVEHSKGARVAEAEVRPIAKAVLSARKIKDVPATTEIAEV